jgi:hypothetical protein
MHHNIYGFQFFGGWGIMFEKSVGKITSYDMGL